MFDKVTCVLLNVFSDLRDGAAARSEGLPAVQPARAAGLPPAGQSGGTAGGIHNVLLISNNAVLSDELNSCFLWFIKKCMPITLKDKYRNIKIHNK